MALVVFLPSKIYFQCPPAFPKEKVPIFTHDKMINHVLLVINGFEVIAEYRKNFEIAFLLAIKHVKNKPYLAF